MINRLPKSFWLPKANGAGDPHPATAKPTNTVSSVTCPTTTQIECGDFFDARDDALRAHRTQVDPEGFFFAVSPAMQRRVWPWEDYSLIQARVPVELPEKDFFAGLR